MPPMGLGLAGLADPNEELVVAAWAQIASLHAGRPQTDDTASRS